MATDNLNDSMINYLSNRYRVPRDEVLQRVLSAMIMVYNMEADLEAVQRKAAAEGTKVTRTKIEWWK